MCIVLLPPRVNPVAVNQYINCVVHNGTILNTLINLSTIEMCH